MKSINDGATVKLTKLRQEIDAVDRVLMRTLRKRFQVVNKIGQVKLKHGLPILQKKRGQQLQNDRQQLARKLGLAPEFIEKLFDLIQAQAILNQKILVETRKQPRKRGQ